VTIGVGLHRQADLWRSTGVTPDQLDIVAKVVQVDQCPGGPH
jgi:hypothetical protein